jgi:biofilm PGA synthesis N-glycosyltransferase PgaC
MEAKTAGEVTVIVPAYNEAESVGETVRSLREQTSPAAEIIVVDDCSSDDTAAVAEAAGAKVLRPARNTGSKAGAQTFALPTVRTELVMAVDADTTLATDAIERLLKSFEDPEVTAACGAVVPRRVHSVWERGRYIEYLVAFGFYKRIQEHYGKPLIASGCFSAYRTDQLRATGGWSTRTLAEDMDLTWTMYGSGQRVRFIPDAVCYPIEPYNLDLVSKQLRRWSHGFVQNVRFHRRSVLELGYLRSMVAVAFCDALFASLGYVVLLPALAIAIDPWILIAFPTQPADRALPLDTSRREKP